MMITHWKINTLASIQFDRNKIFVTIEHTLVHKIKINSPKLHLYLNANQSASYDLLMNTIKITWNIVGHWDFVLQHQLWSLTRQTRRKKQRFYIQDDIRVKTRSKHFLLRSCICVEGQKKLWKVSENSRIPYGIWNVYRHANLLRA